MADSHVEDDDIEDEEDQHQHHYHHQYHHHHHHDHEKCLREERLYTESIIKNYNHLHPHLLSFKNWQLHPSLLTVLQHQKSPETLRQDSNFNTLFTERAPGLYTFPMLSEKTCQEIIEEAQHFEDWCTKMNFAPRRPNSMNNYGAILDEFGFEKCLDEIVSELVNPFSDLLFPHIGLCDSHHGFLVEYKIGKDVKLDFHVDDSEVTLNVCLGKQFTKGDLYFGGVRCLIHQQTQPRTNENIYFQHQPGVALLHLGKHRHAAGTIESGERLNLILWCRSSTFRSKCNLKQCPEWCKYE